MPPQIKMAHILTFEKILIILQSFKLLFYGFTTGFRLDI